MNQLIDGMKMPQDFASSNYQAKSIYEKEKERTPSITVNIKNEKEFQSYTFSFLSYPRLDGGRLQIVFSFTKSKDMNEWNFKGDAYSYLQIPGGQKIELKFAEQVKMLSKKEKDVSRQAILLGIEKTHKLKEKNIKLLLLIQDVVLNYFH